MLFKDLGLSEKTLKAIDDCGYTEPTPIQEQAIPLVLMARDVVGLAQTGTGKTASFTLPMIEILSGGRAKARMPRSLILTPTRELAAQIAENFDTYGKYHKLEKALLVGGVSMDKQVQKLDRGVDVLIATPGRLLDLFERGKILLTDIKVLVIDEADRMLDMGFIPDIEKIVSLLSPMRQTLLFSATMSPEIRRLTEKFLSNPKEVAVAQKSSTADNVEQFLVWTDSRKRMEMLGRIIKQENVQNAFIFCNRKRDIDGLSRWLSQNGYSAKGLHGDMAQAIRTKTLGEFKDGAFTLLVCSDVAARGLDVSDVSHVFNFNVPFNAEDYVHRIGRTGRAGQTGHAWTLAVKGDEKFLDAIEKLIKTKIPVKDMGGARASSGDGIRASKPSSKPKNDDKKQPSIVKSSQSSKGGEPRKQYKKEHSAPQKKPSGENSSSENRGGVQGFGDAPPGFFGN